MSNKQSSKESVNKDLQKLPPKAIETVIAILTTDTKTDAAKKLDISRVGLYKRIDAYNLAPYIEEIPRQALQTLQQGSIKAAENIINKISSFDENISIEASKETLDRVGINKGNGKQGQVNVQINNIVEEQKKKYNLDE